MNPRLRTRLREGFVVALSTFAIAGVGFVFAAPSAPPPGSTIPLPLTRGSTAETKAGALTIQGQLTAAGGICLGGVCRTSWPSSSLQSGTVTITPGVQAFGYNSNGNWENNTTAYYTNYGQQQVYSNSGSFVSSNFSITAPSGISSGVLISSSVPVVRCYSSYQQGYYTPAYCNGTYYCSSSPYTYATNVVATTSNTSVTLTGTCKFYTNSGYYGTAVPDAFSATYLY